MAEYTSNLELYKKDPIVDKDDTFNITTMLNDNWDKIDVFAKNVEKTVAEGSTITDPQTKSKYKWGIENGLVYLQEVE